MIRKSSTLVKNLMIVVLFIVLRSTLVHASCNTQKLFDENKGYIACRIVKEGVASYSDPSVLSEQACNAYCTSCTLEPKASPVASNQLKKYGIQKMSPLKGEVLQNLDDSLVQTLGGEMDLLNHPACVLSSIQKGNLRFSTHQMSHPNLHADRRLELVEGQNPSAIILSCSDSRVSPELLMDQGLGDLFVVRTAGHVLDSTPIASIEYALEFLKTSTIIVMGHEGCGAVTTALSQDTPATLKSKNITKMTREIRTHLKKCEEKGLLLSPPSLYEGVKCQTESTIEDLLARSPLIRQAVKEGKVKIIPAFAHIKNGKIDFWESTPKMVSISWLKKVKHFFR